MREAILEGSNGRILTLRRLTEWADEYEASLSTPNGAAQIWVYDYRPTLAAYFRDLADSWSGFEGTKSYRSVEGDLSLDATHDGLGTLTLSVTVGDPAPPEWFFAAAVSVEAGSSLDRIASSVENLFR